MKADRQKEKKKIVFVIVVYVVDHVIRVVHVYSKFFGLLQFFDLFVNLFL